MADRVLIRILATREKVVARSYSNGVVLANGEYIHRTKYKIIKPLQPVKKDK